MYAALDGVDLALLRVLEFYKQDRAVAEQEQPVGPARLRAEHYLEGQVCDLELVKRPVANPLLNTLFLAEAFTQSGSGCTDSPDRASLQKQP